MAMPWTRIHLLLLVLVASVVTSFRTKATKDDEGTNSLGSESQWTPTGDCHDADGKEFSEQDKANCLVKLVEEVNADPTFQTFVEARTELLRRVDLVKAFGEDTELAKRYKAKEDSVFTYVQAHSDNLKHKLDTYSQQFELKHKMDHKTFTEKWLLEKTGEAIQLEGVIENPTFEDFVGVYDIKPMSAYIASKMIIDESDFMGMYGFGSSEDEAESRGLLPTNTYAGVDIPMNVNADAFSENQYHKIMDKMSDDIQSREQPTKPLNISSFVERSHESALDTKEAKTSCGCSDAKEHLQMPHALGEGEYVQFRLRNENVRPYMDNGVASRELMKLVPDTPNEPIYIFTVSSNGVMRFHPWGITARKLWHALGDSEKALHLPLNIWHAGAYGCFCFGIIYKERENYERTILGNPSGEIVKGGRTIVMRYNRWATDNAPIYAMIRQRSDETDISIPEQPGNMFTGIQPEILEDLFLKLKDTANLKKWLGITSEKGEVLVVPRRENGKGYPNENPILALGNGDNITATSTHIKNGKHIGKDVARRFTTSYDEVFGRIAKDILFPFGFKDAYLKNFETAAIHGKADSISLCNRKIERAECWSGFAVIQCVGASSLLGSEGYYFGGTSNNVHLSCTGVGLGEPCLQRAGLMSVHKPRSKEVSSMCAEGKCKCASGSAPAIQRCTCQHTFW